MKKHNLIPLNIQLFGEEEGGGGQKTYTQEEFDAIVRERDNLKNRTDELSKNEKALKEQLKNKLSDDEKQKQEKEELDKQLQAEIQKLRNDNLTYKIKGELVGAGYNEKEIETLTKHILANDIDNLVKELSNQRKALKDELTKTITADLQKQNKLPGGQGGGSNDKPQEVLDYLESKKGQKAESARDFYLKK